MAGGPRHARSLPENTPGSARRPARPPRATGGPSGTTCLPRARGTRRARGRAIALATPERQHWRSSMTPDGRALVDKRVEPLERVVCAHEGIDVEVARGEHRQSVRLALTGAKHALGLPEGGGAVPADAGHERARAGVEVGVRDDADEPG